MTHPSEATDAVSAVKVWALTTGEAGIAGQVRGLAAALGGPFETMNIRLRRPWSFLPAHRIPGLLRHGLAPPLTPPWPDLLITCGKRSAFVSAALRRTANGKTFTAHIQNPRLSLHRFDLVIAPRHDRLKGPNVLETRGALHGVTPDLLAAARAASRARLGDLGVAVLLGGRSRSYRFTPETVHALGRGLAQLDCAIAVTPSRRTEPGVIAALKNHLPGAWFWDGTGDNPYLGMLACARHIVVTEDSVSMTSEAISTGKPVHVARMAGRSRRLQYFHALLREEGVTRPFDSSGGALAEWSYEPVSDAPRIAAELHRRMNLRDQP